MLRLIACLLALPASLAAQDLPPDYTAPGIASLEAGVICAVEPLRVDPAPDTVSGTKHVIDELPPFVSTGRLVPAVRGVGFGVSARAADPLGIAGATMMVTHPPMGDAGATRQSFPTGIPGDEPGITFYQFDYGYELLPGRWTLTTISAEGEILFSVPFDVVPPESLPQLAEVCDYEDLLS